MKKILFGLIVLGMTILTSTSFAQGNNQQIADEVMNMVKAQWAVQAADPTNFTEMDKNTADDYTEFNSSFATRIDGKALASRLGEASGKDPSRRLASEMLNPKVQVYGDVAILTYNFAGQVKNKGGEVKPTRAKSTRVYAKMNGKWKLVHANFAADPMPED
jgi:ketosteroid isomerase-like protein